MEQLRAQQPLGRHSRSNSPDMSRKASSASRVMVSSAGGNHRPARGTSIACSVAQPAG